MGFLYDNKRAGFIIWEGSVLWERKEHESERRPWTWTNRARPCFRPQNRPSRRPRRTRWGTSSSTSSRRCRWRWTTRTNRTPSPSSTSEVKPCSHLTTFSPLREVDRNFTCSWISLYATSQTQRFHVSNLQFARLETVLQLNNISSLRLWCYTCLITNIIKVHLYWSESDMFILDNDKDQRKKIAFAQCKWTLEMKPCSDWAKANAKVIFQFILLFFGVFFDLSFRFRSHFCSLWIGP